MGNSKGNYFCWKFNVIRLDRIATLTLFIRVISSGVYWPCTAHQHHACAVLYAHDSAAQHGAQIHISLCACATGNKLISRELIGALQLIDTTERRAPYCHTHRRSLRLIAVIGTRIPYIRDGSRNGQKQFVHADKDSKPANKYIFFKQKSF